MNLIAIIFHKAMDIDHLSISVLSLRLTTFVQASLSYRASYHHIVMGFFWVNHPDPQIINICPIHHPELMFPLLSDTIYMMI